MLVSIAALAVQIITRRAAPIPPAWIFLGGHLLLAFSAYYLWLTANTSYRLSADGLQVRCGPYRRNYRWDDFSMAYLRSGLLPMRLTLQPVTRLSDVVTLETRAGGNSLDLTPHDPEGFMRQITALAPQLAHAGNR